MESQDNREKSELGKIESLRLSFGLNEWKIYVSFILLLLRISTGPVWEVGKDWTDRTLLGEKIK